MIAVAFIFSLVSVVGFVLKNDGFAMPNLSKEKKQANTVTGTVIEAMDTSGYTYMHVDTGKDKIWVAIPVAQVKKGDKVTYHQGMIMPEFHSKTLNRSFKKIVFSSGLVNQKGSNPHGNMSLPATPSKAGDSFAEAVKAESGPAATSNLPQKVSGGSAGATAPFMETKVEKATGQNGYTVEELYGKSNELKGKKVRVNGKVVKYNQNIMGRNWIHLQDGTGDPKANTHDLVITTAEKITSQDIITIEGTLITDKDFGAGYKYAVIIEEAKIIK